VKICLYVNNLGRASQNGTAITIMSIDIAKALKALGHEVFFVLNKNIIEENLDFKVYPLHKEGTFLNGELPYAIRLSNILKTEKPDVVMSFMKAQTIVLSIAKIINPSTNIIYIGNIQNNDAYYAYGKNIYIPYRYLIKFLYEKLDYVVVPSYAIKKDLQETFFIKEDKFKIIPNCINFEKLDELSEEACDATYDFINIGRLTEQKGQIYLVEAFKKVKEKVKDAKLIIIGEGELRSLLENKIKEIGLENDVILAGYQTNPYKYLKNSKIFVLSSIFEGFGNVIIEAMHFGLPVISYECPGGPKEILKNKFGVLVPPKDVDALANAMIDILENQEKQKYYSNMSKKRALDYNCKNYAKTLISLKSL
jgi:glycosyltransferase involved in cell wall biosynthesis